MSKLQYRSDRRSLLERCRNGRTTHPVVAFSSCSLCSHKLCSIDRMQACIANFLLLLTLVGGFTPFLQALSGVQPHACCLRRMHATGKHTSEISSGMFGDGNCCPPLTTPQSAQVVPSEAAFALPSTAPADLSRRSLSVPTFMSLGFSDRAPPA